MKKDFLGIPVDIITMKNTINFIDEIISTNKRITHSVINAGKIVLMSKDKSLYNSVISCDLINADGQSIVWAMRFLGKKIPERVAGIDIMQNLVELAYKKNYKCFFLGAKEDTVKKVINTYAEKYNSSIIAGYHNGYFTKEDEINIAKTISESEANILFVAITSPKKEEFLYKYKELLKNVNFTMGVGGSFDVIAGVTKRAPLWMQKIGLEWFYRFIQEPKRMWKRYLLGNLKFLKIVLNAKFNKEYKITKPL